MTWARTTIAALAVAGIIGAGASAQARPTMTVDEARGTLYAVTHTTREALNVGVLDWVAPDSEIERQIREAPAALRRLERRIDALKARVAKLRAR